MIELAKLNFLFRDPSCPEKVLTARGRAAKKISVDDFEQMPIQAGTIRSRHCAGDHCYRRFLKHSSGPSPCSGWNRAAHDRDRPDAEGKRSAEKLIQRLGILAAR